MSAGAELFQLNVFVIVVLVGAASVVAAAAALPRPTIDEQADEVGRELRNRERYYPGRFKPETAYLKLERMRAAYKTLLFMAKHADGLRLLLNILQRVEQYGPASDDQPITDSEAEMLQQLPAVRAVLDAFPGCKPEFHRITTQFCVDGESSSDEELR